MLTRSHQEFSQFRQMSFPLDLEQSKGAQSTLSPTVPYPVKKNQHPAAYRGLRIGWHLMDIRAVDQVVYLPYAIQGLLIASVQIIAPLAL